MPCDKYMMPTHSYGNIKVSVSKGKVHTPISWSIFCWRTLCGKWILHGYRDNAPITCYSCIRREQEDKRPQVTAPA